MPYPDEHFDTILLVSILEHLKPAEQVAAFAEMRRVLKPGGQVVYGTPVERPMMVFLFKLLGHDIRLEHFSTERDASTHAGQVLENVRVLSMRGTPSFTGPVYEIGHFRKRG
jgi:ubiquinone/menaquinone biosynthesis C-methylase UbiE